ncbi:unnamed protein product [Pleuronectes platessa]|uniref:Uncharacterized protein n=1 Tax=Pleuronectes platessa TaxID=8262 RepID=A0A9N7VTW1_PLEPL|nr:unnamed protein product [Pleuronectes platessa]
MKMSMVLLVATVALLVSADAAALTVDKSLVRNRIIDMIEAFNASSFKDELVPDVEGLAYKCGSKFFCKVSDILDNNKTISTWPKKEELVEHLKMFHQQENVNCKAILKNVHPNGVHTDMKLPFDHLSRCLKRMNFNGTKKGNP